MRMPLRIKKSAYVMLKTCINYVPGNFIILCIDIRSATNPDCRKTFQFFHRKRNRSPVRFNQPFIKQTHTDTDFCSEPNPASNRPLCQFLMRNRIEILLKKAEYLR